MLFASKKFSFSKDVRRIKTQEGPSPCSYTVGLISQSGVTFTKSPKNKSESHEVPGPGAYEVETKIQEKKSTV